MECHRKMIIATHDGRFHADEAFAIAALERYLNKECQIIRTRNKQKIAEADFRIDVGMKYDPKSKDFDHHQGLSSRKNGVHFASFGLIWMEYGASICGGNSEIAEFVEKELVYSIDAHDNGWQAVQNRDVSVGAYTISKMIEGLNQNWRLDFQEDEAFHEAIEIARRVLSCVIDFAKVAIESKTLVREACEKAGSLPYVIVEEPNLPWEGSIYNFASPSILYVIFTKRDGIWRLQCLENNGIHRKSLPLGWRGLENASLAEETGAESAIFCLKNGFMITAKSRDDIILLAEKAISS